MKSPKPQAIKLPYASTIASYANDQGGAIGNSFLGALFRRGSPDNTTRRALPGTNSGQGMLK